MNISKEWVIEYSKNQNSFHRCTQKEREENELFCKQKGIESDFNPIISFDTVQEADEFIDLNYDNIKNGRFFKTADGIRII